MVIFHSFPTKTIVNHLCFSAPSSPAPVSGPVSQSLRPMAARGNAGASAFRGTPILGNLHICMCVCIIYIITYYYMYVSIHIIIYAYMYLYIYIYMLYIYIYMLYVYIGMIKYACLKIQWLKKNLA